MNISNSPSSYAASHAQRLIAHLLQQARGAGQNQPSGDSSPATDGPASPPPPGPPPGGGAPAFVSKTLASLLSVQEDPSGAGPTTGAPGTDGGSDTRASKLVDALMKSADTNGDGKLNADEISAALGGAAAGDLSTAISKLDTDGDGELSTSELTAALKAQEGKHAHHAHHGRPSPDDIAASLIGDADSDGDGSLSLDEVKSALAGGDSANSSNATDGFNKLDTDGDGKLSASELSTALAAFRAGHHQSAQSQSQTTTATA